MNKIHLKTLPKVFTLLDYDCTIKGKRKTKVLLKFQCLTNVGFAAMRPSLILRSSLFISLHKHKTKNTVANLLAFLILLDAKISHNQSTEKIMLAYSNEAFLTLLDITWLILNISHATLIRYKRNAIDSTTYLHKQQPLGKGRPFAWKMLVLRMASGVSFFLPKVGIYRFNIAFNQQWHSQFFKLAHEFTCINVRCNWIFWYSFAIFMVFISVFMASFSTFMNTHNEFIAVMCSFRKSLLSIVCFAFWGLILIDHLLYWFGEWEKKRRGQ